MNHKDRTVELGKKLVEELENAGGTSTLCSWTAYYIAELINRSEAAEGADKLDLEKECFERIISLWGMHRALPAGVIATQKFDSIIGTLDALSPKESRMYFVSDRIRNLQKGEEGDPFQGYLNLIHALDDLTRRLMRFSLCSASKYATDDSNLDLIKSALGAHEDKYAELVIRIAELPKQDNEDIKYLKESKLRIEKFRELSDLMCGAIDEQIEELEQKEE